MRFGQRITRHFNITYPRMIDGAWIRVPVLGGFKVGIRGELFLLEIFKHFLPQIDGAVVDVGANVGQTLAKVKLASPEQRYYGFEPNASCIGYLERLVADNGWQDVTLFPFGLAESTAVLSLHVAANRATDGKASFVSDVRSEKVARHVKHAAVFDYSAISHLIDDKVALVKIDVEGAELDVLTGLQTMLARDLPVLCIEFLPLTSLTDQHKESFRLLQAMDYEIFGVAKYSNKRWAGFRLARHYVGFDGVDNSDFVAIHKNSVSLLKGIPMH